MQRHTMTKKSKPQQKHRILTASKDVAGSWGRWGGGSGIGGDLHRFYVATTLALSYVVSLYTQVSGIFFTTPTKLFTYKCMLFLMSALIPGLEASNSVRSLPLHVFFASAWIFILSVDILLISREIKGIEGSKEWKRQTY